MFRALKVLFVVGLLAAMALPATAQAELVVPDSCVEKRLPELEEDEVLVEHELFLTPATPVANDVATGADAVLNPAPAGVPGMSPDAPTSPVSTTDVVANPNTAFHQNFLASHWTYQLPEEQRIVCFGATLFGSGFEAVTAQLWLDDPYGVDGATLDAEADTAIGDDPIAEITTFPLSFDKTASSTLTLQVVDLAGMSYFGSTTHPASFTYVTVETVES